MKMFKSWREWANERVKDIAKKDPYIWDEFNRYKYRCAKNHLKMLGQAVQDLKRVAAALKRMDCHFSVMEDWYGLPLSSQERCSTFFGEVDDTRKTVEENAKRLEGICGQVQFFRDEAKREVKW